MARMAASGSVTLWDLRTRAVRRLNSLCSGRQGRLLLPPTRRDYLAYGVEDLASSCGTPPTVRRSKSFGAPTPLSDPRAPATEAAFSTFSPAPVSCSRERSPTSGTCARAPRKASTSGTAGPSMRSASPPTGYAWRAAAPMARSACGTPPTRRETLATLRANGGVSGPPWRSPAMARSCPWIAMGPVRASGAVDSRNRSPARQRSDRVGVAVADGHLAITGDRTVGLGRFQPRTGRAQERAAGLRGVAPVGGGFAPIDAGLADNGRPRTTAHRQASSCGARATVPR